MINSLTYNDYLKIKESSKIIIIYFGAPWCGVCQMVKPNIQKLDEENTENLAIYEIDTSEESELTAIFKITSIPTTVVVYQNKIIAKEIGYRSIDYFKRIINNITPILS